MRYDRYRPRAEMDRMEMQSLFKIRLLPYFSPYYWLVYRDDNSSRHAHFKTEEEAKYIVQAINNGFLPYSKRMAKSIMRLLTEEEYWHFMNKDSTRYYSGLQEEAVAKEVEGRVIINSGATAFKKGDVEFQLLNGETMLLECKTKTDTVKQFAVKKEWIKDVETDSFRMGCNYSGLVINFDPHRQDNYVVMDLREFKTLIDTVFIDGKIEGTKLAAEELAIELFNDTYNEDTGGSIDGFSE